MNRTIGPATFSSDFHEILRDNYGLLYGKNSSNFGVDRTKNDRMAAILVLILHTDHMQYGRCHLANVDKKQVIFGDCCHWRMLFYKAFEQRELRPVV